MTTKIKRTLLKTYMWTNPPTNTIYSLIGDGVTTGIIAYNPKVTEEQYISEDSARVSVDSYAPKMPIEMTCKQTDPVWAYIESLRIARAVLAAAETYIFNVWCYAAGYPLTTPAEKQLVAIQIDSFGSEGGVPVKINYILNFLGDPTPGTFNVTVPAFT